MSLVLQNIHKQWSALIAKAKEDKWKRFGAQADEANQFYQSDDAHFMFSALSPFQSGLRVNADASSGADPSASGLVFEATANLTANVVSVFLPVLYHKNPNRVTRPRTPTVPPSLIAAYKQAQIEQQMMQLQQAVAMNPALQADPEMFSIGMQLQQQMMATQAQQGPQIKEIEDRLRAALIEWYLNYTPGEMNLKGKSRDSIIEAIVKGLGLLWATVDTSGGRSIACLEYDSVDHLLIDPDCERLEDAKWIARRRKRPVWEVEREFGITHGTLTATDQSSESEAESETMDPFDREFEAAAGKTSDLVVYWEVWSRMGVGGRLHGFADQGEDDPVAQTLEKFGDYAYLVICPTHDHPLNLPEEIVDADATGEETSARLAWPIPFYKNRKNPWPFAGLAFRKVSRSPWPMSYVHPALGYQKCINWILSFLMARIKIVSRAIIVMPDNLEDDIYKAVLEGKDLTLVKLKATNPGEYAKMVDFVKMPEENGNIWTLLQQLKREWEDATGVTELNMSARTDTQMRSAAEADLKDKVLQVRPDDMANEVDSWMSDAAKLEAIAARYLLEAQDVAPIFGEESSPVNMGGEMGEVEQYGELTDLWVKLVQTDDVDRIVSEYDYTIESGSARKPNKTQQVQNIDEGGALVVPDFKMLWSTTGDPTKFNAWLEQWAKTRDMNDWEVLKLPDMQMQIQMQQAQAAAAAGGGPPPGSGPPPGPEGQPGGGAPPEQQPPPQPQGPPQ